MMELLTTRDLAVGVAERWRRQYGDRSDPWPVITIDSIPTATKAIHEQFLKLGGTPDPHEIEMILGNDSWTSIVCSECHQSVETAVAFQEFNAGPLFYLCTACLCNALHLTPYTPNPERLEVVAEAAIALFRKPHRRGATIDLTDEDGLERTQFEALRTALHDAGYAWEELT